jgi:hypothetical protein
MLCGCTSLDLKKPFFGASDKPKPETPIRMVDIWTEEVLTEPGLPTVRGFAGRVMFYNDKNKDSKPIAVDGTLSVFVFDESDRESDYSAPEKKFVYKPEQLAKYYSKSELGHSYSVWLPWDEVGGKERKLCLIGRFEPKKGGLIVSKPSHRVLSGTPPKPGEPGSKVMALTQQSEPGGVIPGSRPSGVSQVAYEMPVPESLGKPRPETITIDVPKGFAEAALNSSTPATLPNAAASRAAAIAASSAPAGSSPTMATAATAGSAPTQTQASPAAHSLRSRLPAQREASFRSRYDRVRTQPLPATWLSPPQSIVRPGSSGLGQESPPEAAESTGASR